MSIWSQGRYEATAVRLEPAAAVAVAVLAPGPGERVLDVGCGTGNAALAAARGGAEATGVDTATRLLEVARARAAEEGLTAEFTEGDAVALPVADASFDAALSVFGVIFAEPAPAAGELLRVVRPGGRIIFTTWVPGGPTNRVIELMREALGGPPQPPRWSSEEFVRDLFAPHEVRTERHALSFTAPSAAEFVREQAEQHPMWLAALPRLDELGRRAEVLDAVTAVMAETNEDPGAFRTTSEYDVVTVLRG